MYNDHVADDNRDVRRGRDTRDRRDVMREARNRYDDRDDYYQSYDEYSTADIQDEIDRLRRELNTLRRTVEERNADKAELINAMQAQAEQLVAISSLMTELPSILKGVEEGVESKLKSVTPKISEELEDSLIPVSNKCEVIDERIKGLSDTIDIAGPIDAKMDEMSQNLTSTLASKFGSKTIGDVLKGLSTIQIFVIANTIGTVTLLVLMAYFIFTLM